MNGSLSSISRHIFIGGLIMLGLFLPVPVSSAATANGNATSETNAHLKKWFAMFPDADTNADGIMT